MFLTVAIIFFTLFISFRGKKNPQFFQQFSFDIQKIKKGREYYRFISSAFFHEQWTPLIINMIVLFSLGTGIEVSIGKIPFLVIFLLGIVGGNLLTWVLHKGHSFVQTSGASGAVSALVFASITIMPNITIFMLPGWVFGVLYILLTSMAIRSQKTYEGHVTHLGGAIMGMITASILFPHAFLENYLYVILVFAPALVLFGFLLYKPNIVLINKKIQQEQLSIEDKYNLTKLAQRKEVDRILDKINNEGLNSLSAKERTILNDYSKS